MRYILTMVAFCAIAFTTAITPPAARAAPGGLAVGTVLPGMTDAVPVQRVHSRCVRYRGRVRCVRHVHTRRYRVRRRVIRKAGRSHCHGRQFCHRHRHVGRHRHRL